MFFLRVLPGEARDREGLITACETSDGLTGVLLFNLGVYMPVYGAQMPSGEENPWPLQCAR